MLYFFVANIKNIIHSMQVLNVFNSCTDTMGPLIISFITCSYKIVKALIGSRIFTQGSIHAHLCRQRSCLNCHEPNNWNKCQKELSDNCQSDVSCNWNISFSLSLPPELCSSHQPNKLVILRGFIKQTIGTINTLYSIGCLSTSYIY